MKTKKKIYILSITIKECKIDWKEIYKYLKNISELYNCL